MGGNGNGRVRFGDYELDSQSGKLFRDGWPVKIQPQPLRVLSVLLEQPGEIVSRERLRARIWGDATFVEFDQGLNYCIRQIRLALRDGPSKPRYIETLPKQGYRFIAPTVPGPDIAVNEAVSPPPTQLPPNPAPSPASRTGKRSVWAIAAGICAALAITGLAVYRSVRVYPVGVQYTQLTDFTDSALAPALSPDGHILAFIRGNSDFLTADQIYAKVLPNGEPKLLTDDRRLKYNLAFSPDGSQIAYTVLENSSWATYTVSVFGGDSHLLLNNAAGLTWLNPQQVLFSEIRSGLHMGIVTGTVSHQHVRDVYFPAHERGMAHYSYASPDRKSVLVVEMNERGGWAPCRLVPLDGRAYSRLIGPPGPCTSAGWSPDGLWMYFTASIEGHSHLWRQRFPNGRPEQITSGPTEEQGVAVERDGRSIITSMGVHESAIWIHDPNGERSMSSEGEIISWPSPPSFSADGKLLYYLVRRQSADSGPELWRMTVDSGKSEALFPGISMLSYDISPDGRSVVYSTAGPDGRPQVWLAAIDRRSPAKRIGRSGETSPHFGPRERILFQLAEGNSNYLEQMNQDGSGRSKVVPYPIDDIFGVSPGRRWVMAAVPFPDGRGAKVVAIAVDSGVSQRICSSFCIPAWSSDGSFLFVPVEAASRTSPGRSLAIPVGPAETLPPLPPNGIEPMSGRSVVPGAQPVDRAQLVPGKDIAHFAYVNTTVNRNLYRISLP